MKKTLHSPCDMDGNISRFYMQKLSTPSIIGPNMVLQRGQPCPIWGWASPNAYDQPYIFAGKTYRTKANQQGDWRIKLDPLEAIIQATNHDHCRGAQQRI